MWLNAVVTTQASRESMGRPFRDCSKARGESLLDGILGAIHRSREQSDGAYKPYVLVLDESIERRGKVVVSCHGMPR